MRNRVVILRILAAAGLAVAIPLTLAAQAGQASKWSLRWSEFARIPEEPGQSSPPNLVGAYTGVEGDVLLIAGGQNPDAAGAYQDGIRVLRRVSPLGQASARYEWVSGIKQKLPRPLAHGVSISTARGLIGIGGCDGERCYPDVFRLHWNPGTRKVDVESLPPLPQPAGFAGGALAGDRIYVAGGADRQEPGKTFWSLDLSKEGSARFQWEAEPAWPGPARTLPVVAAQKNGSGQCVYLFGGRGGPVSAAALDDGYAFQIKLGQWTRVAGKAVAGAAAVPSGVHHILVLNDATREVLAYDTITDTWVKNGDLPGEAAPAGPAAWFDKSIVIPGARLWKGIPPVPAGFHRIDYVVLCAYIAIMVLVGVYFSRRMKTTDDYFKAGKRIPFWAAGMSVFSSHLSAITFLAIPAKTFATDWRYFWGNMGIVMALPFVVTIFLPFYRRLNVTTAYEYLEMRFNLACRLFGSLVFVALQLCRIGIVVLLPSIAMSVATSINVYFCVIMMSAFCVIYTIMGGVEACIWVDVLQVIVLAGGALLCLLIVPFKVPGGWNGMLDIADAANKLRTFDFRFHFNDDTFWVLLLGATAANFFTYGADQNAIQRYLTTKDERSAARSIWTHAALVVPVGTFLFFLMGTALYAFYHTFPAQMTPFLPKADALMPFYIVTQLPAGLAGLAIAGVFAASMANIDSSMNSVATALTNDFYRRLSPTPPSDRSSLRMARWITFGVGVFGTGISVLLARSDVASLWDQSAFFIGLFGSGLVGMFLLGIFTHRGHGLGAIIGLAISLSLHAWAKLHQFPMHDWLYALTNLSLSFLLGYILSLILPRPDKSIEGLTLDTLVAREGKPEGVRS